VLIKYQAKMDELEDRHAAEINDYLSVARPLLRMTRPVITEAVVLKIQ